MTSIGIYNYNLHARGGGERKTAVMAEHFSRKHDVSLIVHQPIDLVEFGAYFNTDLSRVSLIVLSDVRIGPRKTTASHAGRTFLNSAQSLVRYLRMRALRLDVFINNSPDDTLPSPCRNGVYMCMFPTKPRDAARRPGRFRGIRRFVGGSIVDRIGTYAVVTANSRYTSDWIDRWWGCPSEVIFSTPEDMGPPAEKEKIILNVGRFSNAGGENHPKQQMVLLKAFQEMTDLHEAGWVLHFAGSLENTPSGEQFLTGLREAAVGYPIEFHGGAKLEVLRDLYRRAAIYWHATGYGFPAETYPKRQEHLGMTPLEAMSAGAVPIVINAGGLRETVAHARSGFRWDNLDELKDLTRRVAGDPALRAAMSEEALHSLSPFRKEAFLARMDRIVAGLLAGGRMDPQEQTKPQEAQVSDGVSAGASAAQGGK